MEFNYDLLINYGAMGVCLAYFIYRDNITMKGLRETVQELKECILMMKERLNQNDV